MGNGIMALVNTRPELKKYFTKKGTLRKQRGQPRLDLGIEFVIYAKIDHISKFYKLSMWKAWERLTEYKYFPRLIGPHFQKQKRYKGRTAWRKLITDPYWKKNYYKNHLKRGQLNKRLSQINFEYKL